MTFLDMIQSIMSAMNSDDVSRWDGTEESIQVASIIVDTYNELMTRDDWNYLKKPVELESASDANFPTTLKIPDNVVSFDILRYDMRKGLNDDYDYQIVTYKDPQSFLDYTLSRSRQDPNVGSFAIKDSGGVNLLIRTDSHPTYWTSFDEKFVTMDSYYGDLDNTVRGIKTAVYATVLNEIKKEDTFIPDIPANVFPQLLAECKKACFFYLKESGNPIDDKRAFTGNSKNLFDSNRAHERKKRKRYGRPR